MLEAFVIILGICVFIGLSFQLFGWFLVLPFKIFAWTLQGLVGLVVVLPAVIIACCFLGILVPVLLTIIAIPVGIVAAILNFVF